MSTIKHLAQLQTENGFEHFFREFYPSLKSYAQMFVPVSNAEDIVQDILLLLWEQRFKLSIHTSLEAYLFKAVYQRCLNFIKREKMIIRHLPQIEQNLIREELNFYNPDNNPILREIFTGDFEKHLDEALQSLPPKCREVFVMSFLKDYKNREIGEKLNISVNTVESHITAALKALRKKLAHFKMLLFCI